MNELKKKTSIGDYIILSLFILFLAVFPVYITGVMINQRKEYDKLEKSYYEMQIEYAEEFAELSTAYEFLEEYTSEYMSAQENALHALQDRYDVLLEMYMYERNPELEQTTEEFKEKLISDVDDLIDYFWNYQSFAENNPDITFSQYVKIKNTALHTRIKEYFGWTDWE